MADDAPPVNCPHCEADEPRVWDNVLFHYVHSAGGDQLKVCLTPWREPRTEEALRSTADVSPGYPAAAPSDRRRELKFSDLLRAIELHRQEHGDEFLATSVILRVEDSEGELHVGGLYDLSIESHDDEPALVLDGAQDVEPSVAEPCSQVP